MCQRCNCWNQIFIALQDIGAKAIDKKEEFATGRAFDNLKTIISIGQAKGCKDRWRDIG
jgi:hypothetical protein